MAVGANSAVVASLTANIWLQSDAAVSVLCVGNAGCAGAVSPHAGLSRAVLLNVTPEDQLLHLGTWAIITHHHHHLK